MPGNTFLYPTLRGEERHAGKHFPVSNKTCREMEKVRKPNITLFTLLFTLLVFLFSGEKITEFDKYWSTAARTH